MALGLPRERHARRAGPVRGVQAATEMAVHAWRIELLSARGRGRAGRLGPCRERHRRRRLGRGIGCCPICSAPSRRSGEMVVRSPAAVRPWQHVLDCLSGYLALAQALASDDGARYAAGWNFGPDAEHEARVADVVGKAAELWGEGARWRVDPPPGAPHEATLLTLDSAKAHAELGWRVRLSLDESLRLTVEWHRPTQGAKTCAPWRANRFANTCPERGDERPNVRRSQSVARADSRPDPPLLRGRLPGPPVRSRNRRDARFRSRLRARGHGRSGRQRARFLVDHRALQRRLRNPPARLSAPPAFADRQLGQFGQPGRLRRLDLASAQGAGRSRRATR